MFIKLDNVSKIFTTNHQALTALSPINLDIASGEFISLIGPSGCGKSTLLRLIADQLQPSTGNIILDNLSPGEVRRNKGIAWMAQNPALLPWKTARSNIQLSYQINPVNTIRNLNVEELLRLVDLVDFDQHYPGKLSGGMQQRVALARTLAIGASVWLMDEPFAALDEFTRDTLADEVLKLWFQFQPTVIWVTHSIIEAVRMADRVVVISHRPGHIKSIVPVKMPRPRDDTQPDFIALIKQLRGLLEP